ETMPKRRELKDLEGVCAELEHESHRAAIIVGGSLVEYCLEKYLRTKLRVPRNSEEEGILFAETGLFGTFSQKIWAAYFMNLIGQITKRDLDLIRLVRNEVAHNVNPVSFNTPEIASRCKELDLAKNSIPALKNPPDFRGMFKVSAELYASALLIAVE